LLRFEELKLPSKEELMTEFSALESELRPLNSPLVFSHNDLLLGNIVYDKSKAEVTFIDYEYAAYNHQAFDIGNHFNEFAGMLLSLLLFIHLHSASWSAVNRYSFNK
jgi:thiamine kinase-like enzyme